MNWRTGWPFTCVDGVQVSRQSPRMLLNIAVNLCGNFNNSGFNFSVIILDHKNGHYIIPQMADRYELYQHPSGASMVWFHCTKTLACIRAANLPFFWESFLFLSLSWLNWYWCNLVFWPDDGTLVYVTPPNRGALAALSKWSLTGNDNQSN